MKVLLLFTVVAIAICNAQDCSEERVLSCLVDLIAAASLPSSGEEMCRDVKGAIDCIKLTVEECVEESDEELEKELEKLDDLLKENCVGDDEDGEDETMPECVIGNEDDMNECFQLSFMNVLTAAFESHEEPNEKALTCTMYHEMADCIVEKAGKNCGKHAQKLAREDLNDLPSEIAEACAAANHHAG